MTLSQLIEFPLCTQHFLTLTGFLTLHRISIKLTLLSHTSQYFLIAHSILSQLIDFLTDPRISTHLRRFFSQLIGFLTAQEIFPHFPGFDHTSQHFLTVHYIFFKAHRFDQTSQFFTTPSILTVHRSSSQLTGLPPWFPGFVHTSQFSQFPNRTPQGSQCFLRLYRISSQFTGFPHGTY